MFFFTGLGVNASQMYIMNKQIDHELYCGYNNYNFHNQYIQIFAELGFFGFLILLLSMAVVLKGYWTKKEIINLFFFLIMASVFITESYIWRQRGLIHFLVIYCVLIKSPSLMHQLKTIHGKKSMNFLIDLILLSNAMFFFS